jgi:FkbM family methyltransferase
MFLSTYLRVKVFFIYLIRFGPAKGGKLYRQLRTRKTGEIRIDLPPGYTVYLRAGSSDIQVFEQIFIRQHYKLETAVSPISILDIGANIGLAAVYFKIQFPSAKIVCIEPEASNFDMLVRNTRNLKDVKLIKAALWSRKAFLKIVNKEAEKFSFIVQESTENEADFQAVSLDDILRDYNLDRVDLLKMDVEGAEAEVFREEPSWIKKVDNWIIEFHENLHPGSGRKIISILTGNGFRYRYVNTNYFFYK